MAECPDLAAEILEIEAKVAAAKKLRRAAVAEAAQSNKPPEGGFRTFSMVDAPRCVSTQWIFIKKLSA